MDPGQAVKAAETKFDQAIEHFRGELNKIRTGRAHPSMLEGVMVEAYGSSMPIIQTATITAPEAGLLQISPFDPGNLQAIATAIRSDQSLGLNPTDDGRVIRVPIPALTEERRREITKQVGQKHEDCMVAFRNIRHDVLAVVDGAKKDKTIGEDEAKRLEKQVDDTMNKLRSLADEAMKAKEAEIMTL